MTAESFARQNADDRLFAGLAMPPRVVTLGWPSPLLSPNSRKHWSVKAKATKAARSEAFYATRVVTTIKPNWKAAALSVTFNPPDKRRRDRDNLQASLKAHFDGIADALGINDSLFVPTYAFGPVVKGGAVRVEIRPI